MKAQISSTKQVKVLDEIIDNAMELPIESQDWLLMMAKAMRHTRDCVIKQFTTEQLNKLYRGKSSATYNAGVKSDEDTQQKFRQISLLEK